MKGCGCRWGRGQGEKPGWQGRDPPLILGQEGRKHFETTVLAWISVYGPEQTDWTVKVAHRVSGDP